MKTSRSRRRVVIEERAARIVAERLRVEFCKHDDGSEPWMYDYDLCYPSGGLAALEVTEHADEDLLELLAAMDKHKFVFPASSLGKAWFLHLDDRSARFDRVSREVVVRATPFLGRLEEHGITLFHNDIYRPPCPELRDLGICFGISLSEQVPSGSITIIPPGSGGAIGPDRVVVAALKEASEKGNLKKLRESGLDERHLFVWVSEILTVISFGDELPSQPPTLPSEVTHLWVGGNKDGTIHVWTATNGQAWTGFTIPDGS